MALIVGWCWKKKAMEVKLLYKTQRNLERSNEFLDKYKIRPEQMAFEEKVAAGAEAEVWKGYLKGHPYDKRVAIKKALPNPENIGAEKPVWSEREVNFLIKMEHERLVKFIGAGEIYDELFEEQVLCIVQEYLSGGSINNALWNKPLDSLTWDIKLQWAIDIAAGNS